MSCNCCHDRQFIIDFSKHLLFWHINVWWKYTHPFICSNFYHKPFLLFTEKSPKKKKKRFLGFIRRKKPKERQYHSSINLKTETEDATMSDTPTATRQKSVNTLKVPASNQYTRSASTGKKLKEYVKQAWHCNH